jgi:hypothetical protein
LAAIPELLSFQLFRALFAILSEINLKMIISKESPLRKIPVNLDTRQVFIFEGIRYCADMISLGFQILHNELVTVSAEEKLNDHSCTLIFKEAWGMIDTTHRLLKLMALCVDSEEEGGDTEIVENSPADHYRFLKNSIRNARNTFQHLDERIDELLIPMNAPVWGNMSWLKIENKDLIKSFVLCSGHPREQYESTIINPAGLKFKAAIDRITIEIVQKSAPNNIMRIELDDLVYRVERLIQSIESQLEAQIKAYKNQGIDDGTYAQDILITVRMAPYNPDKHQS